MLFLLKTKNIKDIQPIDNFMFVCYRQELCVYPTIHPSLNSLSQPLPVIS